MSWTGRAAHIGFISIPPSPRRKTLKTLVISTIVYLAAALAIAFAPPINGFVPGQRLGVYVLGVGFFLAALHHLQYRRAVADGKTFRTLLRRSPALEGSSPAVLRPQFGTAASPLLADDRSEAA